MITNSNPAVTIPNVNNVMAAEFYGLSTDTKPTKDVPNGSVFIEINTGAVYFFNKDSSKWVVLG